MSLLVVLLLGGCREDRCQNGKIKAGDLEDSTPNTACGNDTLAFSPCRTSADDVQVPIATSEVGAGGTSSGKLLEVAISLKSSLGETRPRTVQEVFFCSVVSNEMSSSSTAGVNTDVGGTTGTGATRDCRMMQQASANEHPFANAAFADLAAQSAVGKCHKSSATRISCLTDANGLAVFSVALSPGTTLIQVCATIDDAGPAPAAGGAGSNSPKSRLAMLEILPASPAGVLPALPAETAGAAGASGGAP